MNEQYRCVLEYKVKPLPFSTVAASGHGILVLLLGFTICLDNGCSSTHGQISCKRKTEPKQSETPGTNVNEAQPHDLSVSVNPVELRAPEKAVQVEALMAPLEVKGEVNPGEIQVSETGLHF